MRIYVGNLPDGVTEYDIRRAFEAHGMVDEVFISRDRISREMRATVKMDDDTKAMVAIDALNGRDFHGRNLNVYEYRPEEKPEDRSF